MKKHNSSNRKRVPTREKLVNALKALNDPRLDDMIKLASDGQYHEYFSEKFKNPVIQLIKDLDKLGFHEMVERARAGEFDAQRWEADQWFRDRGQHMLRNSSLMRGKGREHKTV